MTHIQHEVRIAAAVETVWEYVQDFDRRGDWDVRICGSQQLTEGALKVGSRVLYNVRSIPRMSLPLVARYSTFQRFQRLAIVFEDLPWWQMVESAAGAWLFIEIPGGTLFRTSFRYRLKLGRIGQWLDNRFFRRQLDRETKLSLANLKRIVEAQGAMVNATSV
jgi:hypothetical protein